MMFSFVSNVSNFCRLYFKFHYFVTFTLIMIPFISFYLKNINQTFFISKYLLFYFVMVISFFAIMLLITNLFKLNKKNFNVFFLISIFWYLQFLHYDLSKIILNIQINLFNIKFFPSLIGFLIILFFSMFFTYLFKFRFFSLFVFYFVFISIVSNLIFFDKRSMKNEDLKIKKVQSSEKNLKKDLTNNIKKPQVFYIVADALTSIDNLNKIYNFNTKKIENQLLQDNFKIAKGALGSYNMTYLTMASIFSLDYIVQENSSRYFNRENFYPHMLTIERPQLVKKLDEIGYSFILYSSKWARCDFFKVKCKFGTENFFINLFEDYSVNEFMSKTFLNYIYKNLKPIYFNKSSNLKGFDSDNSIQYLESDLNNNLEKLRENSTFHFVHHYIPHESRNSDCSIPISDKQSNYVNSVNCAFKQIFSLINLILLKFPNAIIVVQGDHGPVSETSDNYYDWNSSFENLPENSIIQRLGIFNAVRMPKICIKDFNSSTGNVETIQMVLKCIGAINKKISSQSKSYIGFYEENSDFGKVYSLK